jgi:hypothetical protein
MMGFRLSIAAGIAVFAVLSAPALAGVTKVTLTPSVSPYVGPCPASIVFSGEITGDKGTVVSYQFGRVIGGTPTLLPWAKGMIPAKGKLTVTDTMNVPVALAGIETETLRVKGVSSTSATISVTCAPNATPTPTPKSTVPPLQNPGVFYQISRVPTPTPTPNKGLAIGRILAIPGPLQAPINLAQVLPGPDPKVMPPACAQHGGSAGSFACYIALPAGKLVLVWDYPFAGPIDGFNVYSADVSSGVGNMQMYQKGGPKPLATQHDPSLHLEVLDAPRPGACYAVTAFHASEESNRSVRLCIGQGGVAKNISLQPNRIGTMVADWYYYVSEEVWKQSNEQPFIRDLLDLNVGYTHVASLWRDQAHTQVSQWTNSLYRGYAYFVTSALNGHTIAQAKLRLQATSGGQTCLAYWGAAAQFWSPGDRLGSNGAAMGGSNLMGPNLDLDVTPIVQQWANVPASNNGFMLAPEQSEVIYQMIILSSTCLTHFQSPTLDVTYY